MARVTIILGWDGINFAYGVTTALMIVHLNLRGACHYHPLFHLARFFSSLTQMSPLPLKAFKSTLGSLPAAAVFLILNSKVGFAPKRLQIHHGFASSWRSLGRRSSQFFSLAGQPHCSSLQVRQLPVEQSWCPQPGMPRQLWWYWVIIGWYWSVLGGTGWILGGTDQYLVVLGPNGVVLGCIRSLLFGFGQYSVVLGHYQVVLVTTWWYWVNIGWYWSLLGVTWSILGGTGQYLMILGHYWVVMVSTWWYWVIIGWYWSVLGGTGWIWGGTGPYLVVLGHYWSKSVSTWCYWVIIGWYWSVLCGTGTLWYRSGLGGTGSIFFIQNLFSVVSIPAEFL